MKRYNLLYILIWLLPVLCITSCRYNLPSIDCQLDVSPAIYPDYKDVTIPFNIAPLNFGFQKEVEDAYAEFSTEDFSCVVRYSNQTFQIPEKTWSKLVTHSLNKFMSIRVLVKANNQWSSYKPFSIHVSTDKIDSFLVYRKIAPGYEQWKEMGIYQRDLSNFKEKNIIQNTQFDSNCMNCHSFANRKPDCFLFHMRQKKAGTYIIKGGKIEKLNTKTPQTISTVAYPSWHPSGDWVAFSTNITRQIFHPNNPNRIEVYDEKSDVVIYNVKKHELVTSPLLSSEKAFETFPTFSADGKTLYYCSAKACNMPASYKKVKYSLCSIDFDPKECRFGTRVDTLYSAEREGKSVSFPRVSPDGRYLMYTLSLYGNFSIWHKDADLYLIDLKTGIQKALKEVNSTDVESYHSWSTNGRWFVFSSRRDDGLYTRPYIAYISEEGKVGKPFMLPQLERTFYDKLMHSFNIPEFVSDEVTVPVNELKRVADQKGINLKFVN